MLKSHYNIVIKRYWKIIILLILPSTILCSMIPALAPYDSVRYLWSTEIKYSIEPISLPLTTGILGMLVVATK